MKTMSLIHLAAHLNQTLIECAASGETLVIELPDQRLLAIQPIDPRADDELVDELLATNARFRSLVVESKMSPRKAFGAN